MYQVQYGGKKGKKVKLVESPDLIAVRTKKGTTLESADLSRASREIVKDSTTVAEFAEANIAVIKVEQSSELESTKSARDTAREELKKEDDIRFAGRVLTDAKSGEVILYTENFFVKFKDSTVESRCLEVLAAYKLKVKDKLVFAKNSYFVQAEEGTGLKVFEISEKLLAEKEVEFCHPELVQERRYKAIHPFQWHLAKTEIRGKKIDAGVNIEAAWKLTKGKGITIAIVDDGVDMAHPEFAGRIVHPRDVTRNSDDANPVEKDDNHGTACAGVACAAGLPDGASGTAPESFLMPIRLRSGLGSMAECNAFVWAADHGADVISCSWGPTDGNWWDPNHAQHKLVAALPDSTRLAMEYAMTKGRGGKGCVILFAAGNGNESTNNDGYASNPGVITVAASNDTGKRSVYSDFGHNVWITFPSGDYSYKPFKHPSPISDGIRTADRSKSIGYSPENYVNSFNGTSSACPGMAGVVALMLAVNPNLTPADVKNLVKISTQKIDEADGEYDENGHSIYYGWGRIDAGLAVANAKNFKAETKISIEGKVKFSGKSGEVNFELGKFLGKDYSPARKFLGFSLKLKPPQAGLMLKYKANVGGRKFLENENEGEFIGAESGRSRILGYSIWLDGDGAQNFEIEYSAQLEKESSLASGKNGSFCGSNAKTGASVEAVQIDLKKK